MNGASSRGSRTVVLALAACTLLGALLPAAPARAAAAASRDGGGLRYVGVLPRFPDQVGSGNVVSVDERRRVLSYLYSAAGSWHVARFRLSGNRMPVLAKDFDLGPIPILQVSSYTIQIDTRRNRLLILSSSPGGVGSRVTVVDLESGAIAGTWDVSTSLPSFYAWGLTYAEQDDRIYLVGETALTANGGNNGLWTRAVRPRLVTAVVALDAGTGATAWQLPVTACEQPLNTYATGALVARSAHLPALYVPCVQSAAAPGGSGVVRLWIDPDGAQADALSYRTDFFPVSGTYYFQSYGIYGVALFDRRSERLYMQSLSPTTPGAWVFDGRMSAWVGFIAAPGVYPSVGLNESIGHYYMGAALQDAAQPYNMLVADGTVTPVPQGARVPWHANGPIVGVPGTRLLFVKMFVERLGALAPPGLTGEHWVALEDRAPDGRPLAPPDYDALTQDIPEGPRTVATFSGGVGGYGLQASLVGGYGGASPGGRVREGNMPPPLLVPGLAPGDRGVSFARVPSIDLREVGASASAQAVAPDTNTEEESRTRERLVAETTGSHELADALRWPWRPLACLDGDGVAITDEDAGVTGTAEVRCDLAKRSASASASFGRIASAALSIASASFDADVRRDDAMGTLARATAVARRVRIAPEGAGSVAIARVAATGTASAHGRSGTARVEWTPTLEGVVVTDARGNVVYDLARCSGRECEEAIAEANDVLAGKARIEMPRPEQVRTPRGAFAAIQKPDESYYNDLTVNNEDSRAVPALRVLLYNDSEQKSRLVLSFAGIQANAIYTISRPEETGPGAPSDPRTDGVPPVVAPDAGAPSPPAMPPIPTGGTRAPTTGLGVVRGALAFVVHEPKEALQLALLWLLFGGSALAVRKRLQLRELIEEGREP